MVDTRAPQFQIKSPRRLRSAIRSVGFGVAVFVPIAYGFFLIAVLTVILLSLFGR
jgi:hypothetical protein